MEGAASPKDMWKAMERPTALFAIIRCGLHQGAIAVHQLDAGRETAQRAPCADRRRFYGRSEGVHHVVIEGCGKRIAAYSACKKICI